MPTHDPARSAAPGKFRRQMLNPVLFRGFLFAKLPLAWFAGLRVKHMDAERCDIMVPRGWRTQNPFRSTYFAAQAMAAELSTGALAMAAIEEAGGNVAMLVVGTQTTFEKKATADATFSCHDGLRFAEAVREAMTSGEPVTVEAETVGRMADGTVVSRSTFTWSFKSRG